MVRRTSGSTHKKVVKVINFLSECRAYRGKNEKNSVLLKKFVVFHFSGTIFRIPVFLFPNFKVAGRRCFMHLKLTINFSAALRPLKDSRKSELYINSPVWKIWKIEFEINVLSFRSSKLDEKGFHHKIVNKVHKSHGMGTERRASDTKVMKLAVLEKLHCCM